MGIFSSNTNYVLDDDRDKVVVLLGKTGVGKSSFINSITKKKECTIGNTSKSCTKNLKRVNRTFDGYNYYFIDTPGLDDASDEDKNIQKLGDLTKYPRISVFLICLKYDDIRLSNSLKNSLIVFMDIFPSPDFWDHVLIIYTWTTIRDKKLERHKKKYDGSLLEGIKNEKDLINYMKKKNINIPSKLKEFYVDLEEEELEDNEEFNKFNDILNEIRNHYPLYKEIEEKDIEIVSEEKNDDMTFLRIITERHSTFTDFNDQKHTNIRKIDEERYNLNYIRPLLIEVKRIQDTEPRGPLCWSDQFKTHYNLVKIYMINDRRVREEYEVESRWETKENDDEGEKYREKLYEKYNSNGCGDS